MFIDTQDKTKGRKVFSFNRSHMNHSNIVCSFHNTPSSKNRNTNYSFSSTSSSFNTSSLSSIDSISNSSFIQDAAFCSRCLFSYFDFDHIVDVIYMRHGARTPKKKIKNLWPFSENKGDLTYLGFMQSVRVGKYLRRHYESLRSLYEKYQQYTKNHNSFDVNGNNKIRTNMKVRGTSSRRKPTLTRILKKKHCRNDSFKECVQTKGHNVPEVFYEQRERYKEDSSFPFLIFKKYFFKKKRNFDKHIRKKIKKVSLKVTQWNLKQESLNRNLTTTVENPCLGTTVRTTKKNVDSSVLMYYSKKRNKKLHEQLWKFKEMNKHRRKLIRIGSKRYKEKLQKEAFIENHTLYHQTKDFDFTNEKKKYDTFVKFIKKYLCIKTTSSERCKMTAYAIICGLLGIDQRIFFFFFLISIGDTLEPTNCSKEMLDENKISVEAKKFHTYYNNLREQTVELNYIISTKKNEKGKEEIPNQTRNMIDSVLAYLNYSLQQIQLPSLTKDTEFLEHQNNKSIVDQRNKDALTAQDNIDARQKIIDQNVEKRNHTNSIESTDSSKIAGSTTHVKENKETPSNETNRIRKNLEKSYILKNVFYFKDLLFPSANYTSLDKKEKSVFDLKTFSICLMDLYFDYILKDQEGKPPSFYKKLSERKNRRVKGMDSGYISSMFEIYLEHIKTKEQNLMKYNLFYLNWSYLFAKEYKKILETTSSNRQELNDFTNRGNIYEDPLRSEAECIEEERAKILFDYKQVESILGKKTKEVHDFLKHTEMFKKTFYAHAKHMYMLCSVVRVAERNTLMFKTLKEKNSYIKQLKNCILNNSRLYKFLNHYYKKEILMVQFLTKWKSEGSHSLKGSKLVKGALTYADSTTYFHLSHKILGIFKKHNTSIYKLKKKITNSMIRKDLQKLSYSSMQLDAVDPSEIQEDEKKKEKNRKQIKNLYRRYSYDEDLKKKKNIKIVKKFVSSYDSYVYHNVNLGFDFQEGIETLGEKVCSNSTLLEVEEKQEERSVFLLNKEKEDRTTCEHEIEKKIVDTNRTDDIGIECLIKNQNEYVQKSIREPTEKQPRNKLVSNEQSKSHVLQNLNTNININANSTIATAAAMMTNPNKKDYSNEEKPKDNRKVFFNNIYECYKLLCKLEYNNKYLSWISSGVSLIDVAINLIMNVRIYENFENRKKTKEECASPYIPQVILYLTHQSALLSFQSCLGIELDDMKIPPFAGFISLELIRIRNKERKENGQHKKRDRELMDTEEKENSIQPNYHDERILNKNNVVHIFCCKEDCVWKLENQKKKKEIKDTNENRNLENKEKVSNNNNNNNNRNHNNNNYNNKNNNNNKDPVGYNDNSDNYLPKYSSKIEDFKNLFYLMCNKNTDIEELIQLYDICLSDEDTHIRINKVNNEKQTQEEEEDQDRYFYGYFIRITFNHYFPLNLRKKKKKRKDENEKKQQSTGGEIYNINDCACHYEEQKNMICPCVRKQEETFTSSKNKKNKKERSSTISNNNNNCNPSPIMHSIRKKDRSNERKKTNQMRKRLFTIYGSYDHYMNYIYNSKSVKYNYHYNNINKILNHVRKKQNHKNKRNMYESSVDTLKKQPNNTYKRKWIDANHKTKKDSPTLKNTTHKNIRTTFENENMLCLDCFILYLKNMLRDYGNPEMM